MTGSDQRHLDIQDVWYAVGCSSLEFRREIWGYKGYRVISVCHPWDWMTLPGSEDRRRGGELKALSAGFQLRGPGHQEEAAEELSQTHQ